MFSGSKKLLLILVFLFIVSIFYNVQVLADGAIFTCADLKQTWSQDKQACVSCESIGQRWNDNLMMCVGDTYVSDNVKLTCEDDNKVWDEAKQACMPCEFYGLTFDRNKYQCADIVETNRPIIEEVVETPKIIEDETIIETPVVEEIIEDALDIIYINDEIYDIVDESDSVLGKKLIVSKDDNSYIVYLDHLMMINMDGFLVFFALMMVVLIIFVVYLLIVNRHKNEYFRYHE